MSAVLPIALWAQSTPALLNGTVTDATGGVVPSAAVTITEQSTGAVYKTSTGPDGLYSFPQLPPGAYELSVSGPGFRDYVQKGIRLNLGDKFRVDVKLEVGTAQQTIEVQANASPLNFENAEQKGGVAPETMGQLPLMVNNGVRSAAQFVTLLPGASSPTGDALGAQLNGGVRYAGEALLNGSSLINPSGGQGMYSAAMDFAQSPDMVSELKVLEANYEPQYGSTGGAVIIMETKSGSNQFHGSAFEFLRNTSLNARRFDADVRPRDIENDYGFSIGGPFKIPKVAWSNSHKTYFFFNWENFRQRGAPTRDWMTIPSLKERQGDFSDWADEGGNPLKIYDPLTTRVVNGAIVRDQFMGCDGQHPNVICPDRFQNSLALQWLKNLPQPTRDGPRLNYLPSGFGSNWNADMNLINLRMDEYIGDKDHISVTVFHRDLPVHTESRLPDIISNDTDTYKYTWANRLNWDHIFSANLLYHFSGGYDHDYLEQGSHNGKYADQLPQIPGATAHTYPPHITFNDSGFADFGTGLGTLPDNKWPAPAFVANQLLTLVKGKHTWKFGFEYRNQRNSNLVHGNESGTFDFQPLTTGILSENSGSPIASFLLEQVSTGSLDSRPYPLWSARWSSWIAHAGDTWKVRPNLTLNLGIRWEMHQPSAEQHDVMSFFDAAGPNPGAGGRLGRLTFAGTRWGDVSFGKRYPEQLFKTGFAPRVGIAYTVNPKTVVRTGYGIFYDAGYYPGWLSGIGTDGFNATGISFGSSNGGLDPAFLLSQGLPDTWARPPFLDPSYLNGQWGPTYRPKDGNRLPYSQQWNFGIERQFTENTYINVAYVGTKGTRLISRVAPLNALDPALLKQYGTALFDEFQPGQTSLHGVSVPYPGWIEQMTACAPSLAQALLPYPQYCGPLQGVNENAGNSIYHSLQAKFEKRFSRGVWILASYTWSKILTDTESNQPDEMTWTGGNGQMISPFERRRNKSLSSTDVPHTFTGSFVYDLPFGRGKRWINQNRVMDFALGGWRSSGIIRLNSGTPFAIWSSNCNVPAQFRLGCLPGVLPGANPFAQDKGSYEPSQPLLNVAAFQSANDFTFNSQGFNYGDGSRTTTFRGFPYRNVDFMMMKAFAITESKLFEIRADFFNILNLHSFRGFDLDVASPTFGMQNSVSAPRYVQVGGRFQF